MHPALAVHLARDAVDVPADDGSGLGEFRHRSCQLLQCLTSLALAGFAECARFFELGLKGEDLVLCAHQVLAALLLGGSVLRGRFQGLVSLLLELLDTLLPH